ncbi:MAG TPA: class I SAM-dependent methyltransferase [Candidatus Angelobacter sp.]|nr:class I SAM-dependent methyltransferase [Candidatus Angelobacter sp.]
MRWFRGAAATPAKPEAKANAAPRTSRRCIGLGEFTRELKGSEDRKLAVLDLGPTSPANIAFLTDRNVRAYHEDILRCAQEPSLYVKKEDGKTALDLAAFFAENLAYPDAHFDAVLCWDVADYLPEELVKPVVESLYRVLKPKGTLLALFHTKDAGPNAPYYHYHIVKPDTLELEQGSGFQVQRIFNNRHIENLFRDFSSRKFFLGRDNLREVIVVR